MFYSLCLYNFEQVPDEEALDIKPRNQEVVFNFKGSVDPLFLGFSALDRYVQSVWMGTLKVAVYFPDYTSFVGYILELIREWVTGIYLAVTIASAE